MVTQIRSYLTVKNMLLCFKCFWHRVWQVNFVLYLKQVVLTIVKNHEVLSGCCEDPKIC